jgi:hypothetical protein
MNDQPMKRCNKCGEEYPATEYYFRRHSQNQSGYRNPCKQCRGVSFGNPPNSTKASTPGYRKCTGCGTEYPATTEYFYKHKKSRTGLTGQCITCRKSKVAQHRLANPDAVRERKRKYHIQHRDQINARSREWYRKNREYSLRRSREWRESNREHYRQYKRGYYLANAEYIRARAERYYANNRDKVIAYQHEYRLNNLERIRLVKQAYRRRNAAAISERGRRFRAENKERIAQQQRRYRIMNPEKILAHSRNARARKRNAPGWHTANDVKQQYEAQKGLCWWCGDYVGGRYHVDHRIPLKKGGTNYPDNICVSCPKCNLSKGAKFPWEFNGRLL